MSLGPGTQLGPYTIVSLLGEGGMGAVWKARDPRLERTVAVKVSKAEFNDRFAREARAVAALNHSHICQLYDVGPDYLVMEFVEGTALKGPLPVPQAIEYAGQILDALDAAHRKGIVHRDLKPSNILVTRQGIKLLDFGLAKQSGTGLRESDATVTQPLTREGQIVGTLQYMSPEQLQGIEADPRSDIFSFGLVFYEMLSGAPAFRATSSASLIASLLKDDPRPIAEIQPGVPPAVERVLRICLAKDPDDRWQNVRDLRRELGAVAAQTAVPAQPAAPTRRMWPLVAAAVLVALAAGFAASRWLTTGTLASAEVLPLTTLAGIENQPVLSPDGKLVAFTWTGADFGPPKICVKQLDSGEPLVLSHSPREHGSPAWSPDGRQIAYLRDGDEGSQLIMVSALGGPERPIGAPWYAAIEGGLVWLPVANTIVGCGQGLLAQSADGSQRREWTKTPTRHRDGYPALSPDGRTLAFARRETVIAAAPAEILLLHLNDKQEPAGDPTVLASGLFGIRGLAWAPDGRSLIVSAINKDSDRLFRVSVPGGKAELLAGVAAGIAGGGLSVSPVAHRMALAQAQTDVDIGRVPGPAWPAGEKRPEPEAVIASTRDDVAPSFSPDGSKIVFESNRTGSQEIWSVSADGRDALQITNFGGPPVGSPRYSPDGGKVAFDSRKFGTADIFVVSATGGPAQRITTTADNTIPAWSSDGKWIFYTSDATGRPEVWKSPAGGGQAVQVTTDGARSPQHAFGDNWIYWWRDGIIWRAPDSGGSPERIGGLVADSTWTPWRDGLLALAGTSKIAYVLWKDHKNSSLPDLPKPASPRLLRRPTLAISSDGKWVLYTFTALDRGDLVLLENFR